MILNEELLGKNLKLPSPPAIAIRILKAVKEKGSSSDDLSRVLSADPALVAKILQVANSSLYALPDKIDSINRAVTILGTNSLKNLALSFVIVKEMKGPDKDGFNFDFFWKRSLTAAVGADVLSSMVDEKIEDVFATALLQDIGIVFMCMTSFGDYLKVLDEKMASGVPINEAERKIFDFDHQQAGALLLKAWGLSENIYMPIQYHHKYREAPKQYRRHAQMLMLSDKLSSIYHGSRSVEKTQDIKKFLLKEWNIEESESQELIDSVANRSIETLSYFNIPPDDMKPLTQILQEANTELEKINYSYEFLIVELKQSKKKAETLAHKLQAANLKLSDMAFRDGLTGLYNHRYFQEAMDKEISRSTRYNRPFSLVMIDLDFFKKVNDEYGHPVGDIVLEKTSAVLQKKVRNSDIVARYGGEEFAVILPETDIKGAAVLTERIRKSIEQMEIKEGGRMIKATISAGVTSYSPGKKAMDKPEIIVAADKALYLSKKTGRNKVSLVQE